MGRPLKIYVVDDSPVQTEIVKALLEKAGHLVTTNRSSADALRDIPVKRPDCVLMDIMMPEIDGYDLCRRIRSMPELADTKVFMMSTKAFPFERRRAAELGASGYFTKPLNPVSFVFELERLLADTMALSFWGVRGTLPISRPDSQRYGGATSCVSLAFPDGRLFIFDAGSGIRALSDALLAAKRTRIDGTILISHPHWDHINALPFFVPFYMQGNQFEICGASHGDITMRDLISAQMDGVYFPVTVREFAASITYRDLAEGDYTIGGVSVKTMLLSHPGNCLGYRVTYGGRSICYVTDNELYDPGSDFYSDEYVDRLVGFAREADVHLDASVAQEACPLNLAPTASTTAALALGDALAVALLDAHGFTAADFARTHPRGRLPHQALAGQALLHVEEVMRSGDAVPRVPAGSSIRQALVEMTRGRIGMTAVVDGAGKVRGVFTDGDLRRTLEKSNQLDRRVDEVMTASPKTVRREMLAAEAVHVMEESKINQLLVVDEQGALLGALNMHDLFRAKVI